MTDKKTEPVLFTMTVPGILVFPALFEPKAFMRNGKPTGEQKYVAKFLLEPNDPDIGVLKGLLKQVAAARWPGRQLTGLSWPLSDGTKIADDAQAKDKDHKDRYDFMRGKVMLTGRSKYPASLAAIVGGRIVDVVDANRATLKDKFFFGAEAMGSFNLVAFEGGNGPDGVTAYLNSVLVNGKGTQIGGQRKSASETFRGYAGAMSGTDPTEGSTAGTLDDEIPF